jgi:hypothetical protein
VEDDYDPTFTNLDLFLEKIGEVLKDTRVLEVARHTIEDYRIYYVLNRFNGLVETSQAVVAPFARSLMQKVSPRVSIVNLGWIVDDERIHKANCRRVPAMLEDSVPVARPAAPAAGPAPDSPEARLKELEALYVGLKPAKPREFKERPIPMDAEGRPLVRRPNPEDLYAIQLRTIELMYTQQMGKGYQENFEYIVQRSLYLLKTVPQDEYGAPRLAGSFEELAELYIQD